VEIIICGDININYLNDSLQQHQLDSLLASYGLYSTVQFPTRIYNSSTAIDNIFINKHKFVNYNIDPYVNGLSDHDGHIVTIYNILHQNVPHYTYISRKINEYPLLEFQISLRYESWDYIFTNDDVNIIFNNFLSTYLRIFNSSFPISKSYCKNNNNRWLTPGIKKSSLHKRELYLTSRHSNDPKFTGCNLLQKGIKSHFV
jgi:hypothetical protein